jgi:Kef-type K+ transport system membrane component KefB/voltage-gated potassium channel Kch
MPQALVLDIVWSIALATGLALLAKRLGQPLILAYVAAGIILGPGVGFGLIQDESNIRAIGEIGLILLLFIIGLEMDLKRLLHLGWPVLVTGLGQVLLSALLALGLFLLMGFPMTGGRLDAVYLAAALSTSNTIIVMKLLFDRKELDTPASRITVGILLIQDVCALVYLAVQPDLQNPAVLPIATSLFKGTGLVIATLLVSRYVLPRLFYWMAKHAELLLLGAIAWCFAVAQLADTAGLSRAMGAFLAGVSISAFPYNREVLNRIGSLRDFFVTLFFVAVGLQVPMPTPLLAGYAAVAVGFVLGSRLLTVLPFLYLMRQGVRTGLLTSINLAQVDEFALILVAVGVTDGHIGRDTASVVILAMIVTTGLAPYMMQHGHRLCRWAEAALDWVGVRDRPRVPDTPLGLPARHEGPGRGIVLLGFYHSASSFVETLGTTHPQLLRDLLVIDANPDVYRELTRRHIRCIYGDVAQGGLLDSAGVGEARLVLCTIPDHMLEGIDSLELVRQVRRLAPRAEIVATAETIPTALQMYQAGADYVLLPRLTSAERLVEVVADGLAVGLSALRQEQLSLLHERREVIS